MLIVSLPALHFSLYFDESFWAVKTFLRPFQAFRNVFTVFPDEFFVLATVISCTLYGASYLFTAEPAENAENLESHSPPGECHPSGP